MARMVSWYFAVEISRVKQIVTKKGESKGSSMAFITASDSSCSMDNVVCFPKEWADYQKPPARG